MIDKSSFIDEKLLELVPEQEALNAKLRARADAVPAAGKVSAELIRHSRLYNRDGSFMPELVPEAFNSVVMVEAQSVPIRVFPVKESHGVYLHFHGGGFVLGSIHEQDALLWACAEQTGLTVISIEYPLAPESMLPETLTFTAKAVAELMQTREEETFVFGGESAGANVMLNTLLRLKSKPTVFRRVKGAVMCYGLFDLSLTPSQRVWGDEFLGLSTSYLEWFYSLCMPEASREQRRNPEVSPLYAELSGMPPGFFAVGEMDPLVDDTLFLFMRWLAAANDGQLLVYPSAPHGFNAFATGMANACNQAIYGFVRDVTR